MSPTKSAFLKRVGTQFRNRRKEKDMTQEDVANDLNMSMSYLGRIERGEANPPIYTLRKIAKVLGLSNLKLD